MAVAPKKKKKTVAGAASIPSVVTFTEPLYPPHLDDDLVKANKLVKVRICLMVSYSCENPRHVRNTTCQVKTLNSMTTAACHAFAAVDGIDVEDVNKLKKLDFKSWADFHFNMQVRSVLVGDSSSVRRSAGLLPDCRFAAVLGSRLGCRSRMPYRCHS